MLKVAIFSHEIPSTTFIENLIEGLADQGIEVYLFGFKRKEVNYKNINIKVFFFPDHMFARLSSVFLNSIKLLIRNPKHLIKSYQTCFSFSDVSYSIHKLATNLTMMAHPVDIFHIQWGGDVLYFEELFSMLDSKFILSFRGAHINYAPIFRKDLKDAYLKYFPKMHAFHAVSNAIAKESLQYGADQAKIKTIYTSVNPALLQHEVVGKKEKSTDYIRMLSVGRFHWKKGYNYAIDAVSKLVNNGVKIQYTIVAQGHDIEEYKFQIHQLKLNHEVEIVNGLPHAEVLKLMRESDIFLLPSLEEGIANVAIEAMAIGTFVVSTDCGGMNELIQHEVNGLIVPVRNSEAIAHAVMQYMQTTQTEVDQTRMNARKTIESTFTRERMIQEFVELYTS